MHRAIKRTFQAVFTIWVAVSLSFVLIRQIPGGPIDYLRAQYAQQGRDPGAVSDIANYYFNQSFDDPIHIQYIDYVTGVFTGDLGRSVFTREPVADVLATALPWTLFVMSIATVATFILGVAIGAAFAYFEGTSFDKGGSVFSMLVGAIPYYILALVMLTILGYQLEWFPTQGRYAASMDPNLSLSFFASAVYHAALPGLSFILTGWAGRALGMRANSISVLGSDFMRVARLRGLTTKRIISRYLVWNAVLPIWTGFLIGIGFMFGGAIITEQIFNYHGIGYWVFRAISQRDYPLMMGGFIVIVIAVTIMIAVADVTYGYIDPRAGDTYASNSHSSVIDVLRRFARKLLAPLRGTAPANADTVRETLDAGDAPEFAVGVTTEDVEDRSRLQRILKTSTVIFRTAWTDWRAKVGLAIIVFYVVVGVFGTWFIPEPSVGQGPYRLQPFVNWQFPLGTNHQGMSILGLLIYAAPPMFKMMLSGAVFATVVSVVIALVSGYLGGAVDRGLMTLSDIAMTLPGLPLLIVIAAIIEPESPYVIGVILTINGWAGAARSLRSEVLKLRDSGYVEASRIMGVPLRSVLGRDVLPNISSLVFLKFVGRTKGVIFGSVGLYYLGVLPYTNYNWGVMLQNAYSNGAIYNADLLYWLLAPMITISLLGFGLILFAQGMDRVFNPRIRARNEGGTEAVEGEEGQDPSHHAVAPGAD